MIMLGFIVVFMIAIFFLLYSLSVIYIGPERKLSVIGLIPLIISGLLFYYLYNHSSLIIL